ncbi:MAG: CDP-diacylglycerol--serine O-phosphatidyltransferase [Gammaproteobacteria bacterium]
MRVIHSQPPEQEPGKAPPPERRRRAGIYLLPNLFTTGALFAGFYGIVAASQTRFEAAAIAVLVAMVLDGMDGRIARMTNTQSDFGAQYDSLADMVSFGLAPGLIIYEWVLFEFGKIGWLAAFMYSAATALRLARFNTQVSSADKRFFQGLPSPAAAAIIAALVWFGHHFELRTAPGIVLLATAVTVAAALLMVSNVRYYSFKDFDLRGRVPFVAVLAIVMVFVLISLEPASVLLILFGSYAVSGLAETWWQRRRRQAERREAKGGSRDG